MPGGGYGSILREVGRIERTLFIIEWILDAGMQGRAQVGLNTGEAHHALKNALRIGRQGKIRDRTTESQHYRIAGLNLLTAIIIYWNTVHLGHVRRGQTPRGTRYPGPPPSPYLTARMGAHLSHRRVPLAQGHRRLGCHSALS
ncbi:transposase family protein [Novosphingobium sp. Rr 2-17]|nr:transposase family protein [Novosphingobium sp. Rr 2-17]